MKKLSKYYKILLSALLIALVFVGGTMAYLIATDSPVLNTFSLANVDNEIEEGEDGIEDSKIVTVKNTGTSDAFVRARVVVSAGVSNVEYVTAAPVVKDDDTIYVVIGTGSWTKDGTTDNDYYYYNGILTTGTSTAALVNGVYCGQNIDADDFNVNVYAESVLGSGTYSLSAAKTAFGNVGG